MPETQLTYRPCGHILTNTAVWSPHSQWIVYDTRSDSAGSMFDGRSIEIVHVGTGEVREIYRSRHGAHCGVATFSPIAEQVAFILGPEHPTDDWQYSASHRQGVIVDLARPGVAVPLDARDLVPPYTPGALRGGSHVHVFSGDGQWVSFTYDDHVLEAADAAGDRPHERNQRNVGVSVLGHAVHVAGSHPRNHNGSAFSVLVTRTVHELRPGSDDISRAFDDAWIGTDGYLRPDGKRQRKALAFQGRVTRADGGMHAELFVVDLPEDVRVAGEAPLAGTPTTRPAPPRGAQQRRLTFTDERNYPGLQGPRHWPRSSPDGGRIACLMRDDAGVVQLWTFSPNGGEPVQVSRLRFDVASAFSWSPDGRQIAHLADGSVFVTEVPGGRSQRLTPRLEGDAAPRPEACVFSPDGRSIAYVRPVHAADGVWNQVFVVSLDG
ncbi:MAG: DUF3748 domain-containing protein, partial [Pirellulales bacterium]